MLQADHKPSQPLIDHLLGRGATSIYSGYTRWSLLTQQPSKTCGLCSPPRALKSNIAVPCLQNIFGPCLARCRYPSVFIGVSARFARYTLKTSGPRFRPSFCIRFETDLVEKQRDQGPYGTVGISRLLGVRTFFHLNHLWM